VRSFILPLRISTETFERPDIDDCFHHSPDENARHQDSETERILSEKRLHVLHPLLVFLLCTAMRRVSHGQVYTILLFYVIVPGSGKQTLQSMQDLLALLGKSCCVEESQFGRIPDYPPGFVSISVSHKTAQHILRFLFISTKSVE
jgi:hypothetical protein